MGSQIFPVSELLFFSCLIFSALCVKHCDLHLSDVAALFGRLCVLQGPPWETVAVYLSSSPLGLSHLLQGGIHSPSWSSPHLPTHVLSSRLPHLS